MMPLAECGDAWTMEPIANGFLVAAIDGLGHGRDAARAAGRAVAAVSEAASSTPEEILRVCHRALAGTRGAAISVARIDLAGQRLDWLGVGNVEGTVLTPVSYPTPSWRSDTLVVRGGVVGYDLPHLQSAHVAFGLGAVLIFATDGIKLGFAGQVRANRNSQEIAEHIMTAYDRGTDDALVLVLKHVWGGSDRTD